MAKNNIKVKPQKKLKIKTQSLSSKSSDDFINPHHQKNIAELARLNKIIGQLEGVGRMIQDGRHCFDLVHLMRSAAKALEALENNLLSYHIDHRITELTDPATTPQRLDYLKSELQSILVSRTIGRK